jgi:hypothetical protein
MIRAQRSNDVAAEILWGSDECDDGQVLSALLEVHHGLQAHAWLAPELHLRRDAGGIIGPERPGFPTRPSAGGGNSPVAFVGRPTGQSRVWPASRIELGDASVLDTKLLAEQSGLLLELAVLGRQSGAGIDAFGGPSSGASDGVVGQGDDVQNGWLDVSGLFGRHRKVWR